MMAGVKRADIARSHRLLRQRAGLTQADVAATAGVGRWKVVDLEAARFDDLKVSEIDRCFQALDATFYLGVWHRGAELDRLLDQRHAALVDAFVALLERHGWVVHVELSFNEFGDRGSIDIVGWREQYAALAIVEVKSEISSIEGTLRPFDVKCRLAPRLVRDRHGWRPTTIGRIILLPEETAARRAVARHAAALNAGFPHRSRQLRAWLREPTGSVSGIWFLSHVGSVDTGRNPSAIRRVRRRASRSDPAPPRGRSAPGST
jgi:hypothetical protein